MDALALVAFNLRKLRVARGLSQEALAVDAGIDRTYVSRMERGMENPTVAVLARLSNAIGVEIVAFFSEPNEGEAPAPVLRKGRRPKL